MSEINPRPPMSIQLQERPDWLQCKHFARRKILLDGKIIDAEIAETPMELRRGLSFRHHLGNGKGMLFIFKAAQIRRFAMRNTYVSLSLGYFDSNRKLFEIYDMEPVISPKKKAKMYISSRPAQFALEVPRGWFERNGIRPGAKLDLGDLSNSP